MNLLAFLPEWSPNSHWNVALIGLLFFSMQLYLCIRFWRRMGRYQREMARLLGDLDEGKDGRDIEAFVKDIPWLRWVDSNFPRDDSTPGNYTRDDVLKELDTQIASDTHYLLLQRAGVMAPLLGVIITVVGFFLMELPENAEQSLGDILYLVTPLVAGVGTGAILAFLNQWLLHIVGSRVEIVRNEARSWFDRAIWSSVGLDTQAATVQAITAMERMARSISQSAEQQEQVSATLRETVTTVSETAVAFQQTYDTLDDRLNKVPDSLEEIRDAARSAVETLTALLPVGQRAVEGLDGSVNVFRTAVESQFVEAARIHRATTETLAESVGRINESTQQLKVGSGDLQETVNTHTNAFKSLNRSLQKQVLPAHEAFLAVLSRFGGQSEGLLERTETLHEALLAALEKLTSLSPQAEESMTAFSNSATSFANAIEFQFAPAIEEHEETSEQFVGAVGNLQKAVQGLADGEMLVQGLVKLQSRLGEDLSAVQESLHVSVDRLAETVSALNQSMVAEMAPSQRSAHQATASFAESAKQLSTLMDHGVVPLTEHLRQLDGTFQQLEGAVVAIREFAGARVEIERLSQALAQAATVAEAIRELPDTVRQILEDAAARNQTAPTNSRGGLTSWLRGGRR